MRIPILAVTLCFLCLYSNAQRTQTTSNLLIGYQEFPTTVYSHATDSSGNQYFTGFFRGQLTINNKAIATGNGLEDVFWVKTDASGKLLKYNTFGSANSESSFPDALAITNDNHMLFGFSFQQQMSIGGFVINPYSDNSHSASSSCLAYTDTAGSISWVKRINLSSFKVFYANNIFHVIGSTFLNRPAVKVEDSVVVDSSGQNRIVHLMFDKAGKLLGAKTISTRKNGNSVYMVNFGFFSDNSLLIHLSVNSDSSFLLNNHTVPLPNTNAGYMVLIKTDTAYTHFNTKVVNPQRQAMYNLSLNTFPLCVGPGDLLYSVISYESTSLLQLDGFTLPAQSNTFAVFDSSLVLRRTVELGVSRVGTYAMNTYKRRVFIKSMIYLGGKLYLNGVYTGINESPMNVIPVKDTVFKMLPGITTTIDQNGPSLSFVAKLDPVISNANIISAFYQWYGDHHPYENMTVAPYFVHPAGKDRFAFVQTSDNVWNPFIVDTNLNVIAGRMQRNADMPETPLMVRYFDDGSRLVIGYAKGKTALDSANNSFTTNGPRSDVFVVRIRANNQVVWYKRFFSTLVSPEIRGLEIKNSKAWFLVNYGNTQNDSNYLKIDSTVYSIGTTASLMANIDSSGTINVISLTNPILKPASLRHFSFFSNGDLALITSNGPLQAGFPNANSGIHIFRIQPATGLIIDKRKITGAPPPSVNTMLIDKNDQVYIFNGEGYIPSAYTMNLYSSSGLLDSLKIDPPLFSQQNSLLKMGWNDLKWLKRSGGNGFSGQVTAGSPFMINDRPVVAIISTDNNQPVYWDGKLIHNGFPVISTSLVELDSNGVMQRNKVIDGFSLRMSRGIGNKQVYLSGMMTKALRIDTIQVNFAGGGFDGLAVVLDSNYTAKKSYRVASPYMETMLDMDIFKDSLVALAYTAQGDPQLYTNRIQANTRDYQEDAYLGTIVTRMDVVTAINTPPASVSLSVSPNPVRDAILHLRVGVDEVLKSSYAIYQSNGQYISGGYEQLLPGKNDYSIPLPAGISKGVYHILISNKSWIATKTFVVM